MSFSWDGFVCPSGRSVLAGGSGSSAAYASHDALRDGCVLHAAAHAWIGAFSCSRVKDILSTPEKFLAVIMPTLGNPAESPATGGDRQQEIATTPPRDSAQCLVGYRASRGAFQGFLFLLR